jgi:hypothetical protein
VLTSITYQLLKAAAALFTICAAPLLLLQVVNERLSPNCRARLTVENDDRASQYSVADLQLVHQLTGERLDRRASLTVQHIWQRFAPLLQQRQCTCSSWLGLGLCSGLLPACSRDRGRCTAYLLSRAIELQHMCLPLTGHIMVN